MDAFRLPSVATYFKIAKYYVFVGSFLLFFVQMYNRIGDKGSGLFKAMFLLLFGPPLVTKMEMKKNSAFLSKSYVMLKGKTYPFSEYHFEFTETPVPQKIITPSYLVYIYGPTETETVMITTFSSNYKKFAAAVRKAMEEAAVDEPEDDYNNPQL